MEGWCTNKRALVWKRGKLAAEVQAWRKAIEPLLFAGPQSEAFVRRKLFWDLALTGDARRRGVIEHYCEGETCCPGGRKGLQEKVLSHKVGILCLLDPAPQKWPRKSWVGQAEVCSHILLLELCGGMISRNLHSLVQMAQARAVAAAARLASLAISQADAGLTASRIEDQAKAGHSDRVAQEARSQSKSAWLFLGDEDSLRRMISFRVILEPSRILKSTILARNGERYHLQEQRKALQGHARSYQVGDATKQAEIHRPLVSITTLALGLASPQWCLRNVAGASQFDSHRRWRLTIRAGGALTEFMSLELSVYPWRCIYLLGDFASSQLEGVEEFIRDARSCKNMCFLDPVFRNIWRRYPSKELLLSAGCKATIRAIQILAADNIANIERQHAGERRNSRLKEQTYLELVADASSAHVLQQLRAITQDRKSTAAEIAQQKLVVASGYDKQEAKQK